MNKDEKIKSLQNNIETLYLLYTQASEQRDLLMSHQKQQILALKTLLKANEVIFKAVLNRGHWKRTASNYLKNNAPELYLEAKAIRGE